MAKLRMKKIEIVALLTDSKKIIEMLQRRGVVEISRNDDEELDSTSVTAVVGEFEKFRSTAVQALDILNRYSPVKKPITEMFESRTEVEVDNFGKGAMQLEKIMSIANDIIRSSQEIDGNEKSISQSDIKCDILSQWTKLDVSLNFKGTSSTTAFIGSVPSGINPEDILPDGSYAEIISQSKEQTNLFILCSKETADETEDILRKNSFVPVSEPENSTPAEIIQRCRNERKVLEKRTAELEKHIRELSENRKSLEFAVDYLQMRKDKYNALGSLGFTENTFVLNGYIPEKYTDKLKKELEKKFTVHIDFTDPTEEDDVPVLLENGRFSAPVESITKMYAMPSKSDVDPTPVMAFFYYLFFGMMLSDAGYGLLMLIGTTVVLKKFRLDSTMKKTMTMFRNCGISTLIWGALFGSWFGDIVQVVGREYFGKEIGSIALWFEPLDDPIKLLLYSFALGILHLFLGVGVSFKMAWDEGRKLDAVFDTVPVYLTILGVAPLASSILVNVPAVLKTIGTYLMVAGVVLIVLTSGRSSKSVFGKFFGGLYALYNTATGYLSDILSYSRLLALGLATGSIAGVINLIGTMPENIIIKTILLVVVFIVGHTANLAINLLGAYVHTDRLQFVELFGKFYTGGGREFKPFTADTQYITFKEEN
ncbi:MAG: V-type ATP synthase subunit I [Ruminococcus flavefaciens]|nr:V-type ATP synthase subunit I [Ruminococcus flavefaciens]